VLPAVLASLVAAAPAHAHAVLTHTTPHRNAAIPAVPETIELDFNEPVRAGPGSVRLFGGEGDRVDAGPVRRPPGRPQSVVVGLKRGLGRGVYTATYRVTSADGHPVSGGFSFGVGVAVTSARGRPAVADLLARSGPGPVLEGLYGVARGLHYGALLLLVGALVFARLAWPRETDARWPAGLLAGAAAAGAVTSLAGLLGQGALTAGVGAGDLLDRQVIDAALGTRAGEAWAARAIGWAAVLALVVAVPRRPVPRGGPGPRAAGRRPRPLAGVGGSCRHARSRRGPLRGRRPARPGGRGVARRPGRAARRVLAPRGGSGRRSRAREPPDSRGSRSGPWRHSWPPAPYRPGSTSDRRARS
jgi:copper transport protein